MGGRQCNNVSEKDNMKVWYEFMSLGQDPVVGCHMHSTELLGSINSKGISLPTSVVINFMYCTTRQMMVVIFKS
jgi:hypothetical protein